MKKILIYVLTLSMLVLCSCQTNTQTPQLSDISSIPEENINSSKSNEAEDNAVSVNSQSTTAQPQKTVINVNTKTSKMFSTNPSNSPYNISKEYVTGKEFAAERYTKSNVANKTFNVLGVEYANLEYFRSTKNQYTNQNYDTFYNKEVNIDVSPNGEICFFHTQSPIKAFSGYSAPSEELAKKYVEKILPNYKYDQITLHEDRLSNWYVYRFCKTVNGISASDRITVIMDLYGRLVGYGFYDINKYDNIEVANFDINDYLQRIDAYVSEMCGDNLIDHGVHDDPYISIYTDNKLELTIPIWVQFKASDSNEYKAGEYVVFELN